MQFKIINFLHRLKFSAVFLDQLMKYKLCLIYLLYIYIYMYTQTKPPTNKTFDLISHYLPPQIPVYKLMGSIHAGHKPRKSTHKHTNVLRRSRLVTDWSIEHQPLHHRAVYTQRPSSPKSTSYLYHLDFHLVYK